MATESTVLVTGSSGHLGSMLVLWLLERGYRVRASVLNPEDKQDLQPLLEIDPDLAQGLEIVKGDVLVEGDFDEHVKGCHGVFHLACPTNFFPEDPQRDVIDPSIQGSLNVLKACIKSPSIKRVVYISSISAIRFGGEDVPEKVFDETCWSDADFITKSNIPGWPYFVAKTLSEKAAAQFAQDHNLDLITINPALTSGPFLISKIPNSVKDTFALITGEHFKLPFLRLISYVHIYDVMRAFILLYEHPTAKGRYICSSVDASLGDVVNLITKQYPEFKILTDLAYLGEPVGHRFDSSKLKDLGFEYEHTLEDMYDGAIKCCREKGLL